MKELHKIKRYNMYHLLGRSYLKEKLYQEWQNLGLRMVNRNDNQFTWRRNDFSYFIEQDLCHYVLWYHGTWEGLHDIYITRLSKIKKMYHTG